MRCNITHAWHQGMQRTTTLDGGRYPAQVGKTPQSTWCQVWPDVQVRGTLQGRCLQRLQGGQRHEGLGRHGLGSGHGNATRDFQSPGQASSRIRGPSLVYSRIRDQCQAPADHPKHGSAGRHREPSNGPPKPPTRRDAGAPGESPHGNACNTTSLGLPPPRTPWSETPRETSSPPQNETHTSLCPCPPSGTPPRRRWPAATNEGVPTAPENCAHRDGGDDNPVVSTVWSPRYKTPSCQRPRGEDPTQTYSEDPQPTSVRLQSTPVVVPGQARTRPRVLLSPLPYSPPNDCPPVPVPHKPHWPPPHCPLDKPGGSRPFHWPGRGTPHNVGPRREATTTTTNGMSWVSSNCSRQDFQAQCSTVWCIFRGISICNGVQRCIHGRLHKVIRPQKEWPQKYEASKKCVQNLDLKKI